MIDVHPHVVCSASVRALYQQLLTKLSCVSRTAFTTYACGIERSSSYAVSWRLKAEVCSACAVTYGVPAELCGQVVVES